MDGKKRGEGKKKERGREGEEGERGKGRRRKEKEKKREREKKRKEKRRKEGGKDITLDNTSVTYTRRHVVPTTVNNRNDCSNKKK